MKVRFFIDDSTRQPHIHGHDVEGHEVEEVLSSTYPIPCAEEAMKNTKKKNQFPVGWNAARVQRVLNHYEQQSDVEAVAEDEALRNVEPASPDEVPDTACRRQRYARS